MRARDEDTAVKGQGVQKGLRENLGAARHVGKPLCAGGGADVHLEQLA